MDALHADSLGAHASQLERDILRPPWLALGRDLTLGLVSAGSKLLLRGLNTVSVDAPGLARFRGLTLEREPGVGLLTYSNHTSTYDDPGLPSALLPWWAFWGEHAHGKMRWTMCARDVCFLNEVLRQFFLNGKAMPVDRGGGAHQLAISVAARRLAAGDWLHVFPEGRVEPAGDVGAFRQGIGKLVCDARAESGRDPLVLPFFHSGMARVMPYMSLVPGVGHEVTVVVGQPVDLGRVTCRCNQPGEDQQEVWRDIAAVLRESLLALQAQAPPNPNQLEERPELMAEIVAAGKADIEDLPPHMRAAAAARAAAARAAEAAKAAAAGTAGAGAGGAGGGVGAGMAAGRAGLTASWAEASAGASAAAAGGGAAPRPRGWCSALRQPAWAEDQQRRQRLWAEGLMRGAQVEGAAAAGHAGQEPAAAEGVQVGASQQRWRWFWRRRRHGEPQQLHVAQQSAEARAVPGADAPRGRWLWAWRRRQQQRQQAGDASTAGGGASEGAAAGREETAWSQAQRHMAGTRQHCVA